MIIIILMNYLSYAQKPANDTLCCLPFTCHSKTEGGKKVNVHIYEGDKKIKSFMDTKNWEFDFKYGKEFKVYFELEGYIPKVITINTMAIPLHEKREGFDSFGSNIKLFEAKDTTKYKDFINSSVQVAKIIFDPSLGDFNIVFSSPKK